MISTGGEQSCEILHQTLNNPDMFEKYAWKLEENVKNNFRICKKELNLKNGPYKGIDDFTQGFNASQ